jgi:hypothetical protein
MGNEEDWTFNSPTMSTASTAWSPMFETSPYDANGKPLVFDPDVAYDVLWAVRCVSGTEVRIWADDVIIGEASAPAADYKIVKGELVPDEGKDNPVEPRPYTLDGKRVLYIHSAPTFKVEVRATQDSYPAEIDGVTLSVRRHANPAGNVKCSQEGWCRRLRKRLQEANSRKKGLAPLVVSSGDRDDKIIGVTYKTDPHDRGMMLNVCPWCGEPILWM